VAADAKAVAADTKADGAVAKAEAADAKAVAADTKADGAVAKAEAADAKAVAADAKAVAADAKAVAADAKAVAADAKAVAADTKAGKAAEAAQAADAKAVAADTKAGKAAEAAQAADAKAVAADTKAGKAATDAANALTTANGIDGKVSKALQAVDKGWTLQTEPGTETTINAANNVVRFKAGDNIKISQTGGNITVALTNDINVTKVTAGTVVAGNLTAKNATLGGAGHTVKVENGTNVDMGGNQIHNVGDGVKDSDAATVGQLNRALDQVAGSPAKINELNNRVDKMNKEMRGYAANAMAVTALPQVYTAGDSMISAAVGSQGGAASVAVGYSRASDNGKVVIKLNMAASSSGEKGVAAGVGYKW
ncbi:TPA: YadA family autotransporter adhesin, partial [Neisseria subflava]